MRRIVEDERNSVGSLGRSFQEVDRFGIVERPPVGQYDLNGAGIEHAGAADAIEHDQRVGLAGADDEWR